MKNNNAFHHYFTPRFLLVIALEVVCFIIDLFIPRGYAVWILYIFPMLLIWNTTSVQILSTVVVVSIFQVAGFIFSPGSGAPLHITLTNKILYLLVFWIVSLGFVSRIKSQSARARSELQYKQLVDAAKSIVLRWGQSGTILFINPYGLQFFGYTSDEIKGKNVENLLPGTGSSGNDLKELSREILKNPEHFTICVNENVRKDGTKVWVSWTNNAITDELGQIIEILSVGNDITEVKHAEQDLKERDDRLRILNENLENLVIRRTEQVRDLSKALTIAEQRERKQFSQILHEDIQQKLFGARILFKQYLRDFQTEGQIPQREDIEDGVGVLEQALTTTKALSIELNPPILSTEGLDAALRWLVTHMQTTYGLKVDLQMQGKVEKVRNATQLMLIQMIREILNNVKQHAGVMNAQLTVDYREERLKISITDTGRGFDPVKVLSEKFDENRLGLLSIKERLKLFSGDLTIQSSPGNGTGVTIVLPYKKQRLSFKDTK